MARIRIEDLPALEELTAEELAEILGAGRNSFRPTFEVLETRNLMSAGLGLGTPWMMEANLNAEETVAAFTGSTSQHAAAWSKHHYAPFIDVTDAKAIDAMREAMKHGVKNFIWGFVEWDQGHWSWGKGNPFGGGLDTNLREFLNKELRPAGGDVMISFGGQHACEGPDLAMVFAKEGKSAAQLATAIQDVMKTYGVKRVDFDVEGSAIKDAASIALRSQAMKLLQQADANVKIELTLPVEAKGRWGDGGLLPDAKKVVRSALQAGVNIERVNIMAMCFGSYYTKDKDGPDGHQKAQWVAVTEAAELTHQQLKELYAELKMPAPTDEKLWQMIGLTPETGINDNIDKVTGYKEEFTAQDAQKLCEWAKGHGIGMLSMWSLDRDTPEAHPFDFVDAFKSFTRDDASATMGLRSLAGAGLQGSILAMHGTAVTAQQVQQLQNLSPGHVALDHYYSQVAAEALLSGNDRGFTW
jgi:hypothetical protein